MGMQDVYLVDIGILLSKEDGGFESYNNAYDKKYGYYDHGQYYVATLERAMSDGAEHLDVVGGGSYVVISKTSLPAECDIDDTPVEGEDYSVKSVVYSARVDGEELVENFIRGQNLVSSVTMEQFEHDSHDR